MRGHVRKRGRKWAVVVDVGRDESGKRQQRWHSGFERRKDAERALAEVLGRLEAGSYVAPGKLTLRGFCEDEWLPGVRGTLRPSTHESYAANLRLHVYPTLGATPLQRLTPAALNALYADLGERLSPRSVRYVHAITRQALRDAVRWDRLARNPADRATPPSASAAKPATMLTWSAEQLAAFLEHVGEDRLYAAWRLAATTGLRRGEVLGLQWAGVDFEHSRVAISRTLISGRGAPRVSQPKTSSSRRSVALDPATVGALREHRKRQLAERLALGPAYNDDQGLVFCREDGEPIWPRTFSRTFERHAKDAGLPRIRLHDLRHTHATLALRAGIHPKVVSDRLGHSTIAITLDTYSHAVPAMEEDAAARIAALLD